MAESATAALTTATYAALTAGTEPWVKRVYRDFAPLRVGSSGIERPYVVCSVVGANNIGGAGRRNLLQIDWQVKAVASSQSSAYACMARISALFQNAAAGLTKTLSGGTDWIVTSVMEDAAIDFIEESEGERIYHAGHVFEVFMESIAVI